MALDARGVALSALATTSRRLGCALAASLAAAALASACGEATGDVIVRVTAPEGDVSAPDDSAPGPDAGPPPFEGCRGPEDCATGQACALPSNVCVTRCTPGAGCSGTAPVCDEPSGLCRACSSDVECAAPTPRCHASGACVACRVAADCSDVDNDDDDDEDDDGDLCDATAGRCVECLDDGHCGDPGESCSRFLGECARPCASTDDCTPDDPICDPAIGFCVECRVDAQCEDDELCRGSECVDE